LVDEQPARFLAQLERQLAGIGSPLLPTAARRTRLGEWLTTALGRVHDVAWAEGFQRGCPVPGAPASAYLHRVLITAGQPALLTGIRFKGGDLRHPFVELLAWDAPVEGPEAWARVMDRIAVEFAHFRPRSVRVRWAGQAPPPVPSERRAIDQWFVAGRLAALRSAAAPAQTGGMTVSLSTDDGFHDVFLAAFARWRAQAGPRGEEVGPADRSVWGACREGGAVVCATVDGRWCGVMAAEPRPEQAMVGYAVTELFLSESVRGRGRAGQLQRRLVEALADHGQDCLWGTIHGSNAPSVRAALRSGRQIVQTWWFVTL
jgi:L-amino acid N-acyltransferase YncA